MTGDQLSRRVLKPAVFILALTPAGYLTWALLTGHLSANPLSDVTNGTGDWTIRFVCITLAVTPLRRVTGWNGAIKFRRMLGLFAFFYGSLHFLTYVVLDRLAGLDFPNGIVSWTTVVGLFRSIGEDLGKRPFILVGFTAFVSMVPLALTSTAGMIRRLGGRRWQALHRLIYVTAIAAVLHYWWLVKADIRLPLLYATIVAVLLAFRVYWARVHARPTRARTPTERGLENLIP
jgi:sulfoxide reductase heme-binding subunit YedZ